MGFPLFFPAARSEAMRMLDCHMLRKEKAQCFLDYYEVAAIHEHGMGIGIGASRGSND